MKRDTRWLEVGEKTYRAYRGQGLVLIDLDEVERSIISGEAGHALYQLMEQYRSKEMLDGKQVAIFQRAMTGWVLGAGNSIKPDQLAAALPISQTPPTDATLRRSLRLLSMVAELHKAGYQRLRIAAGMSPSGCYWRCHITPMDNVLANGWEPLDWANGLASYTTGDEDRYFGWSDAPGKSARQLAQLFLERFPDLARRGTGRDRPYAGWFVGMLGAAESGRLPVFFADWDLDPVDAEMPPPPLMPKDATDPDRVGLIANDHLTIGDLPKPNSMWEEIEPFCITYDGYACGQRSVDECAEIANQALKAGFAHASLDELRMLLFIRQRAARWNSETPVCEDDLRVTRAAIEEIRTRLVKGTASSQNSTTHTILEVGTEGGSIRVVGMLVEGKWKFRLETDEHGLEYEDIDLSEQDRFVWHKSWRNALKALDKFPWPHLLPLSAHKDFRKKIADALKARLPADAASEWHMWSDALSASKHAD